MSLSQDLVDLTVALKAISDGRMDATQTALTAQWAKAWHELATEWSAALDDMIAAADGDQWPSRATILRSERALTALRHTADRLQQLVDDGAAEVSGSLPGLLQLAEDHQIRLIGAQFPADRAIWSAAPVNTRALDAIVQRSTQTIASLSWPIAADVEAAIKSVLIKGVALGENPRTAAADMLKRVGDRFDGGRRRAENIARTEMIDAYRAASRQTRLANSTVLAGWVWTAYLGPRTCQVCVSMHGTEFTLDEPGPNDHQSGRCVATPVTKTWRELGIDLDEPDRTPAKSGAEWFAGQTVKVQREILGPKRYEAWKAGTYPPEQWAAVGDNPGWRPSYKPTTAP